MPDRRMHGIIIAKGLSFEERRTTFLATCAGALMSLRAKILLPELLEMLPLTEQNH
jgi:hypothetical protein